MLPFIGLGIALFGFFLTIIAAFQYISFDPFHPYSFWYFTKLTLVEICFGIAFFSLLVANGFWYQQIFMHFGGEFKPRSKQRRLITASQDLVWTALFTVGKFLLVFAGVFVMMGLNFLFGRMPGLTLAFGLCLLILFFREVQYLTLTYKVSTKFIGAKFAIYVLLSLLMSWPSFHFMSKLNDKGGEYIPEVRFKFERQRTLLSQNVDYNRYAEMMNVFLVLDNDTSRIFYKGNLYNLNPEGISDFQNAYNEEYDKILSSVFYHSMSRYLNRYRIWHIDKNVPMADVEKLLSSKDDFYSILRVQSDPKGVERKQKHLRFNMMVYFDKCQLIYHADDNFEPYYIQGDDYPLPPSYPVGYCDTLTYWRDLHDTIVQLNGPEEFILAGQTVGYKTIDSLIKKEQTIFLSYSDTSTFGVVVDAYANCLYLSFMNKFAIEKPLGFDVSNPLTWPFQEPIYDSLRRKGIQVYLYPFTD